MSLWKASLNSQHTPRSAWRKSSYSGNEDSYCVEVADFSNEVGVPDSKNPDGPELLFGMPDWAGFVAAVGVGHLGSLLKPGRVGSEHGHAIERGVGTDATEDAGVTLQKAAQAVNQM
ncbi:hypothetical protein SRB17_59180 [Streptomyces sp. RB17]|uniref:DUF397 domain-containing protein n=1 Tax=Streptomyces sp. RB17 TaxID=2585197 RepID=UPI001309DB0B|nr:DUF397 domain-containing protein [Streptomyces sp. RB17]MQY37910.1 hypothetical protein [Streptomyces sp. RB17]